jgi:hypothetical protein
MLLMSLACDAIALGSNQVEVEVEVSLLPKNHMLFIVSKQCACSRRVHIEGHMNRFEYCHPDINSDNDHFGSFLSKNRIFCSITLC